MGLKNFFQTAKQDAIDQLVTERVDQLVSEARTETRNELLQELRKMTPEEIADLLARETQATDSNSAAQL